MGVVSGDRDGEHDQRRRRSESDSASALAIRAAQPRRAAASFERTLKFHHRPSRPADFNPGGRRTVIVRIIDGHGKVIGENCPTPLSKS
jgi:hypothetical protein